MFSCYLNACMFPVSTSPLSKKFQFNYIGWRSTSFSFHYKPPFVWLAWWLLLVFEELPNSFHLLKISLWNSVISLFSHLFYKRRKSFSKPRPGPVLVFVGKLLCTFLAFFRPILILLLPFWGDRAEVYTIFKTVVCHGSIQWHTDIIILLFIS